MYYNINWLTCILFSREWWYNDKFDKIVIENSYWDGKKEENDYMDGENIK